MNRRVSWRNSPSAWSSLKLGDKQSAFRCHWKSLDSTESISDIFRGILWAIYQSHFAEWVAVTVSLLVLRNGCISPKWKRYINQATKSISFDKCLGIMTGVPILTVWWRHCHILHSKAGMMLTLPKFSTYHLLPRNIEEYTEPICYISKQFKTSPLAALYHSRYIIWEKHISAECAEVSN